MGEAVPASSPDVLLVEDEALVGLMIEVALTEAGFSVHTFSNGRDALAYLAAGGRADVLFTDIDIAGDIDGLELARRIRALREASPWSVPPGAARSRTQWRAPRFCPSPSSSPRRVRRWNGRWRGVAPRRAFSHHSLSLPGSTGQSSIPGQCARDRPVKPSFQAGR